PSNPAYGPGPTPGGSRQPSMLPVWLGILVLVVGVGGAIAWFVAGTVGLVHRVEDLPRVAVPRRGTLVLTAGDYRIYAEYPGATSDPGPAQDLGPIPVTDSANRSVDVNSPSTQETYSIGSHEGRLVATFHAPTDGPYTITVAGSGSLNGLTLGL